jgi:hypothetical protein
VFNRILCGGSMVRLFSSINHFTSCAVLTMTCIVEQALAAHPTRSVSAPPVSNKRIGCVCARNDTRKLHLAEPGKTALLAGRRHSTSTYVYKIIRQMSIGLSACGSRIHSTYNRFSRQRAVCFLLATVQLHQLKCVGHIGWVYIGTLWLPSHTQLELCTRPRTCQKTHCQASYCSPPHWHAFQNPRCCGRHHQHQ